jgi:protein-S-isoprenylcysteine O-methyltransferase Ste14
MRSLETRIPPPAAAALVAAIMWLASAVLPRVAAPRRPRSILALAVALIGVAFAAAGIAAFRRARTTADPTDPTKASALVTSGIYQITRNPMYVGLLFCLVGWAIGLSSPLTLSGPAAFALYITRYQIEPEERALTRLFGDAYTRYTARVRRWL